MSKQKVLRFFLFRRLLRRSCDRRSRRWCRRRLRSRHPFLESAHAFSKPAHQLRDLASPEKHEDHDGNNQQMHWAVPHRTPTFHARPDALARGGCAARTPQSITRSSPARRVTRSRSRYSSRGIAYLRVIPVNSLKTGTVMRSPFAFLYAESCPFR
jgi:hypothetical protein